MPYVGTTSCACRISTQRKRPGGSNRNLPSIGRSAAFSLTIWEDCREASDNSIMNLSKRNRVRDPLSARPFYVTIPKLSPKRRFHPSWQKTNPPEYWLIQAGFPSRGSRTRTHDIRFWRPTFYRLNYSSVLKAKSIVQEMERFVNRGNEVFAGFPGQKSGGLSRPSRWAGRADRRRRSNAEVKIRGSDRLLCFVYRQPTLPDPFSSFF